MKQYTIYSALIIFALLQTECSCYERQDGCDLDMLNVKGDVLRIETIVESTMPLTEMFADIYDPQMTIDAIGGNYLLEFDNHGNVAFYVGYGIDGEMIFDTYIYREERSLFPGIGGAALQEVSVLDSVVPHYDEKGRVVELTYLSSQKPIFVSRMDYDSIGNVVCITKEYCTLTISGDGHFKDIKFGDTTNVSYADFDTYGNWHTAFVEYKGLLKRHAYKYKAHRRLTYLENLKKEPLIDSLMEVNQAKQRQFAHTHYVMMETLGSVIIPDYLRDDPETRKRLEANLPLKYTCYGSYDSTDAYATFLVNTMSPHYAPDIEGMTQEEMAYNKNIDNEMRDYMVTNLAKSGTYIFKWLPYRYTTVGGRCALCMSYYRYGQNSPIPVYCENYTLAAPDGRAVNVTFSYQANQREKFHGDLTNAVKSITFR